MYIGTPPQSGFITTAKQRVTSSTNNYVDLDHSISSLADVILWVNFIKQDSTNLSLTTSTRITLGATLVASDIVEIAYLGKAVATQTPDTGTVTNDMLAGSIANSKLSSTAVDNTNTNSTLVTGQTAITSLADTDKFLVSDASDSGNLKYVEKQYLPSGSLVFISGTTSASSVTNVVFDEVFSATYKNYKIVGEYTAVDSSGDTASRFKFRTGGSSGSDLSDSEYNYHFLVTPSDSNVVVNKRNTGDSVCEYTTQQDDNSDRHGVRFDFTVFDPFSSGRTALSGQGRSTAQDGNCLPFTGACDYKGTTSITGIKFFVKTGNIKDIAIKIYGIVDS